MSSKPSKDAIDSVEVTTEMLEAGGDAGGGATTSIGSASLDGGGSGNQPLIAGSQANCHVHDGAPVFKELVLWCAFFIVGIFGYALVSIFFLYPHERLMPVQFLESSGEYVRRLSNNEVFEGETVSTIVLLVICGFLPFGLQLLCNQFWGRKGDIFRTICTYSVTFTITIVATECVKSYVGYLRPVFFTECEPDEEYQTCNGGEEFGESELRKSFVSGHASIAFCGCTLFTMFLERTFGLSSAEMAVAIPSSSPPLGEPINTSGSSMQPPLRWSLAYRKHPGWARVGSILSLLPMALATFVAVSRVHDNVHFPADIVGGAVLGGSVALYCHPLWFPDPRFLS